MAQLRRTCVTVMVGGTAAAAVAGVVAVADAVVVAAFCAAVITPCSAVEIVPAWCVIVAVLISFTFRTIIGPRVLLVTTSIGPRPLRAIVSCPVAGGP